MLYSKCDYPFMGGADTWQKIPAQGQLLQQKQKFSSAEWVLPFTTCTARIWQNNHRIYVMDFTPIHHQPCFASHAQRSQILTGSIPPPLKYTHLALSFSGIWIISTNLRQSRQIIHLKGLGPIWLGRWVCYNGIKIQKMSYTPLLFAALLIILKAPEAS